MTAEVILSGFSGVARAGVIPVCRGNAQQTVE